jgi:hypothetical protein
VITAAELVKVIVLGIVMSLMIRRKKSGVVVLTDFRGLRK